MLRWEQEYNWPLGHRADNGDLVGLEQPLFFDSVEPLNHRARALRVVLVNQFGWSSERCGRKMPADMTFADLRRGSDVEFGQSIYEPFGIAQAEPLSAGALCVPSNVCGYLGFVGRAAGGPVPNIVVADYVSIPYGWSIAGLEGAMSIGQGTRDAVENINSIQVAREILARLPKNDAETEALLKKGYEIASRMSWDVVVRDYLLPSLHRA